MVYKAFIVDCHFCGHHEIFNLSKNENEVDAKLKKWGWIKINDNHFCNKECRNNYIDDKKQLEKYQKNKQ